MTDLAGEITRLWEARDVLDQQPGARDLVYEAVDLLDRGEARVAEIVDEQVVVNAWAKEAILLLFKLAQMETVELGPFEYADKIPLKHGYERAGVRVVPGASARWGAYLAPRVVLMPSYVNIGAYVDEGSMVDTWATVGSCAQIGKRVHLAGGVGIGGVLEPPSAVPVVIEDDVLIGSRCMITQGARVERGSILGEGVILNRGIPVIDAQTGEEVGRGHVPPYSIVVQASRRREFPGGEFGLPCALIIRRMTEAERADRETINDVLREHGVGT
ncbi:MAG: 2,3,4,5-tetrahydropyridine-2,6-dicarboxylate N-succinyltransferase [Actinobacteria bacterium]|nr:2,3,4,5-tetrahydropyridine-2,6-dicarboxylate N-succinyltransferase [Actinomycetota bacterium]